MIDTTPSATAPNEVPNEVKADMRQRFAFVTGPSGAGRTTAIRVLEDLGWEVIDNLPLSLLGRLVDGPSLSRPLALGIDVRNRDFGVEAVIQMIDRMARRPDIDEQVLYLDCDEKELVRRYSETRRRHPLAPEHSPITGIRMERDLLIPIRARADILVDTTDLSPHDLRSEIEGWFGPTEGRLLGVTLQSFSYKRGLPRGLDMVFDCRFLRNPHWDPALRALDGREADVARYVEADPLHAEFFARVRDMILFLLPAFKSEGKSHLSIGFGCTGGQHRSVAITDAIAKTLAEEGWQVSKRHREIERQAAAGAATQRGREG